MTLLLDVGNTRLKWAVLEHGRLTASQALAHDDATRFVPPAGPRDAVLATVASAAITSAIEDRLREHGIATRRLPPPRSTALLQVGYDSPATLGVDRWLALLAASDQATLVVSCGSALTIDLVDSARRHRGGIIAPSPERMREALLRRAPHLESAAGDVVDFARNTGDALASGAVLAAVALIERQWQRARAWLGEAPRLWIAGGGRDALLPHLALPHDACEQLVFDGMRRWLALEREPTPGDGPLR